MQYRTRVFGISPTSPSMIPASDFLNTDTPWHINTLWQVKADTFKVDPIPGKVPAGSELYYMYCKKCDNSMLVASWGLYLEENENKVPTPADCSAHGKFKSLRAASEAMLDLNDVPATRKERRTAPRCQKTALSSPQGPLRCSFARLAWEQCALKWGYLDAQSPESALIAKTQTTTQETADFISQMYIQADEPMYSSRSQSFLKTLKRSRQQRMSQVSH